MSADAASAPIRHAPIALWRVARAFLHTLHTLFGAPEDVAASHTLSAKAHALMASWLRCAEAMLRHLLLIEAAAYEKPNAPDFVRPARKRARRLMSFSANRPETWRVSFRCFTARVRRRRAAARRQAHTGHGLRSAWPLAERYEALLRVFNDPTHYARRVSRRLHAAPARAAELTRAPPEAEHRVEGFADFGAEADTVRRRRFSSD